MTSMQRATMALDRGRLADRRGDCSSPAAPITPQIAAGVTRAGRLGVEAASPNEKWCRHVKLLLAEWINGRNVACSSKRRASRCPVIPRVPGTEPGWEHCQPRDATFLSLELAPDARQQTRWI